MTSGVLFVTTLEATYAAKGKVQEEELDSCRAPASDGPEDRRDESAGRNLSGFSLRVLRLTKKEGRLIRAREDVGLTQRDVAEQLGMFHSRISKTESGDRRLDVMELILLADLYGKSPQYFLEAE